jgi:WD40 repeat protein
MNKWVYLNNSYNDLNKEINLKLKTIKDNVDNNIKKINEIISNAQNIKDIILNAYNNYLNVFLPLINIYKILLYNSKENPNNILNSSINSFNFDYIIELKKNFNLTEIINDSNSKINNEISKIKTSLTNIIKNINFIFSKINFKYENNEISQIKTDNPFKINKNSKQHFTHLIKTLTNHNGAIYKIIKLTSGKFASCSADGTIIIWDDYLMEMNVKIQAHNSSVNSICEIENNILISCSNDKSIKLWNINDDYNLIKKIINKQPVISIFKLKDGFFSSFSGNEIKIYSNKKYDCIFTKIIFDVSYLCYINNNIFAASKEDCSIEIFNLLNKNEQESFSLKGIEDLVSTMTPINNNKLICGYYEGDIIVWDIEKRIIEIEIQKAHEYNINVIILLNNNNIASASNDKKIKIWDLYNKQLITCFVNAHNMSIRAMIQINNGNIVSGGSDEEIKIWG